MVTEYPEGKNMYQAFNIYKKRSLDFFKEYPKEINDYSQMFQNKDIWITEWNLQVSKLTGKTHIQSLFVFCYLMEVACNKELRKINLMSFHNLAGRDISSSVIINREKSSLSTTFAAFKLLSDIFVNDRITVVRRSITNEFFEYEFHSEKNEKFFVCINWSERPKKVDISEYDYVINATSLGLKKNKDLIFDVKKTKVDCTVIDIVMDPEETILIKEAIKYNRNYHLGKNMLVSQINLAGKFFNLW